MRGMQTLPDVLLRFIKVILRPTTKERCIHGRRQVNTHNRDNTKHLLLLIREGARIDDGRILVALQLSK